MKELILLKSGEIMMKGQNRKVFEDKLMKNAKKSLEGMGKFKFYRAQSAFYIEPLEEQNLDTAVEKLSRVFGFSGISRSRIVEKDFEEIKSATIEYLDVQLRNAKTFKVFAKRSDKSFPFNYTAICTELGGYILDHYPHLKVDVHNPELEVVVEIRDYNAFIHTQQLPGAGGMPVGSSGRAALLLSGGIDSPVAGYMMAKRGVQLVAIHFESPPYTSARALEKVETLCEKMSAWCGPIKFYTVPFTKPQEELKRNVPEQFITLVMRRLMMRISENIAKAEDCGALITGECLAQVASQTLRAIASTDSVMTSLPILRPVIGMDKEEIVTVARKIDTFETSILPYEDCCTVFTPKHPKTNPTLEEVAEVEMAIDVDEIVKTAVESARFKMIG